MQNLVVPDTATVVLVDTLMVVVVLYLSSPRNEGAGDFFNCGCLGIVQRFFGISAVTDRFDLGGMCAAKHQADEPNEDFH